MNAQALPKTQELVEKLELFSATNRRPSEFDIRLLKRDIEKLKDKIDYPSYYDFLGKISCLENSKKNIISYYENAIKLSPNDYNIQRNYIVSLSKRGFLSDAILCSKKFIANFPNDLFVLGTFFDKTIHLCRFNEALELSKILKNNLEECPYYDLIESAVSIFNNANLSDDEAQYLCELAYSVLQIKNLYFSGSEIEIIDDCVCYTIYIDVSIEEAARIDFELSYLFAEKLENMRDDVIVFEYKSVETLKL